MCSTWSPTEWVADQDHRSDGTKGVTHDDRKLLKQRVALWFTGLSDRQEHLAVAVEQVLIQRGHATYVLDGDNVRFGLNAGPKI